MTTTGLSVDALVDEGLGNTAYLVDLGDGRALAVDAARDLRSVRELAQDGQGTRNVRWSNVPAHGTVLLSRDPDLIRALVEWFQQTLR